MSMTATEKPDVYYATFAVEIAETSEDTEKSLGKVKAIVSTYDNAYQMGVAEWHRFKEGAFAAADGTTVPLFWQHNHSGLAPQPPIGVGKLAATSRGLELDAQFFTDSPAGRAVFGAIKADAVREWSIGYIADEFEVEEADGKVTLNISKSSVLEASSALKGANPQTRTLAAASAEAAQKEAALAARLDAVESVQDNQTDDLASLLPLKDAVVELATRLKAVEELLRVSVGKNPVAEQPAVETAADTGDGRGEEETVEHPDTGAGGAAAATAPKRAPDFLPPIPEGERSDREDIGALERVMRAWNRAERDSHIKSLIAKRDGDT
jgi:HK97 family phage prohead protease